MTRLILTLLFSADLASAASLNPVLYEDLKTVVAKIRRVCPPADCHAVMIGQSPAPVYAFLHLLDPSSVSTVPLTQPQVLESEMHQSDVAQAAGQLFDRFLPSKAALNGKRVLVVDLVIRGRSLDAAARLIRRHYGVGVHVETFALKYQTVFPSLLKFDHSLSLKAVAPELGRAMWREEFDPKSPYGSYRAFWLGERTPLPEKEFTGEFLELEAELAQLMREDPDEPCEGWL